MKKRILGLLTVIMLILSLAGVATACSNTEKAEYTVTVLSPEEDPVQNTTVSWRSGSKTVGSAKTDADGVATTSLPLGTYTVVLDDLQNAYSYPSVSVSSAMRDVMLTLSAKQVTYTVTVINKDGAPASGVVVTWNNGSTVNKHATTNASGVAECELAYGDYTVTLSSLPNGNVYDGAKTVTGANPSYTFNLVEGEGYTYSVTVKSEGGLLFKDHAVSVYSGGTLFSAGNTNDNGVYSFFAKAGEYTVTVGNIPDGYTADSAQLTETSYDTELTLRSAIITDEPAQNKVYVMGDIFHNYTFTTPYELGDAVWSKSVQEILAEKEVLILNNWGTNCSYCVKEMPAMQEMYEKYGDQIEIVAVSNYSGGDSNTTITNYYLQNGYTFPMMRDTNGFASKFRISGWPTTVVIDRYGAIARIEAGAIPSTEGWERLILKYIGNEYVQDFVPGAEASDPIMNEISKPDIELPEDHYEKVAAAMNDTNLFPRGASIEWFGETEDDTVWPFILGTDTDVAPGETVMYASNTHKPTSWAAIYANVTVQAGKVLHFDYYAQTERNDVLSIVWDGKIVKTISGNSDGWQTCYLYTDLTDGTHTLVIAYVKDGSGDVGKDNVYFRRFGFADVTALETADSIDMLRSAAYGTPAEGASQYPYYAEVKIGDDGYYHVDLSKLHNSQFAGNDESPLLLVDLMNATNWSPTPFVTWVLATSEETGEYLIDCNFTINGEKKDYRPLLIEYMQAAVSSDVEDCVPVNQELHDVLVQLISRVKEFEAKDGKKVETYANEWLEACYFYSHYGNGNPVGNPILGLMDRTAIPVVAEQRYTANLTRNTYPFPTMIYTFTPQASAVYEFRTYIPEADEGGQQYAAQMWLYDDATASSKPLLHSGEARIVRNGVNEQNVVSYRYLTAGHKYYIAFAFLMAQAGTYDFTIKNVGQSKTQLVPASGDTYKMILDDQENVIGMELSDAVEYVVDDDGYYHAKNPDGTMGDFLYLDLKFGSTTALGFVPIEKLVDRFVVDPLQDPNQAGTEVLDYQYFDFRYRVVYIRYEEEGEEWHSYTPKVDYSLREPDKYINYTPIVKGWIKNAETEGEYAGMIKVNQTVVDCLQLYIEMRVNMTYIDTDGKQYDDLLLDNEWLRFCWYTRTYNSANP